MIQLNLLPEIKREYITARRQKRLIVTVSSVVIAGSLAAMVLLFGYINLVKLRINDLTEQINDEVKAIRSIEDIDKILTIQNQLNSVQALHETNPKSSRVFDYLKQLTPQEVEIDELTVKYADTSFIVSGKAQSFVDINKYVDAFKFVTFTYSSKDPQGNIIKSEPAPAFTSVTSELSRDSSEATFTLTMLFDPLIFDNTKEVTLAVPDTTTTRSILNAPKLTDQQLFEGEGE